MNPLHLHPEYESPKKKINFIEKSTKNLNSKELSKFSDEFLHSIESQLKNKSNYTEVYGDEDSSSFLPSSYEHNTELKESQEKEEDEFGEEFSLFLKSQENKLFKQSNNRILFDDNSPSIEGNFFPELLKIEEESSRDKTELEEGGKFILIPQIRNFLHKNKFIYG